MVIMADQPGPSSKTMQFPPMTVHSNTSCSSVGNSNTAAVVVNVDARSRDLDNGHDPPGDKVFLDWIRQNFFLHSFMEAYFDAFFPRLMKIPHSIWLTTFYDFLLFGRWATVFYSASDICKKIIQFPMAEDLAPRWAELDEFWRQNNDKLKVPLVDDAKVAGISGLQIEFLYPYFQNNRVATQKLRAAQASLPINCSVSVNLAYDVETIRRSIDLHVPRRQRLKDISMSLEDALKTKCQMSRLVGIFGNVGVGKTHLSMGLIGDGFIYIPIKYADTVVRCPTPEYTVQLLADCVLRRCFSQHYRNSLTRPIELLKQCLGAQHNLTLILDPADDALEALLRLDGAAQVVGRLQTALNSPGDSRSYPQQQALPPFIMFIEDILSMRNISMVVSTKSDFLDHPLVRESEQLAGVIDKLPVISFTPDEANEFLTKYFGSSQMVSQLSFESIRNRSGNNPRTLGLLARMIKEDKKWRGKITEKDFEDLLGDTDSQEGKEISQMENVVRRRIQEFDTGTQVILEAVSLHPTHFTFDDIMDLLDVEKAHAALLSRSLPHPEYDDAARDRYTVRCKCLRRSLTLKSRRELMNVCKEKLRPLLSAAMVIRIKDGCYELDSYIRKIALTLFKNPLDDLKIHFCCLQLKKSLSGCNVVDSKNHLELRQTLLMMLHMYPDDQFSAALNLSKEDLCNVLGGLQISIEEIIGGFVSSGVFYDPREYFRMAQELRQVAEDSAKERSNQPSLTSTVSVSNSKTAAVDVNLDARLKECDKSHDRNARASSVGVTKGRVASKRDNFDDYARHSSIIYHDSTHLIRQIHDELVPSIVEFRPYEGIPGGVGFLHKQCWLITTTFVIDRPTPRVITRAISRKQLYSWSNHTTLGLGVGKSYLRRYGVQDPPQFSMFQYICAFFMMLFYIVTGLDLNEILVGAVVHEPLGAEFSGVGSKKWEQLPLLDIVEISTVTGPSNQVHLSFPSTVPTVFILVKNAGKIEPVPVQRVSFGNTIPVVYCCNDGTLTGSVAAGTPVFEAHPDKSRLWRFHLVAFLYSSCSVEWCKQHIDIHPVNGGFSFYCGVPVGYDLDEKFSQYSSLLDGPWFSSSTWISSVWGLAGVSKEFQQYDERSEHLRRSPQEGHELLSPCLALSSHT